MTGILGGLPPGLRGYVAAENQNQRQTMGQLGMLQGILGMQGALMQQQQMAQTQPLQLELMRAQVEAAKNPSAVRIDTGGAIELRHPRTNQLLGVIPKTQTPDSLAREAGQDRRFTGVSGNTQASLEQQRQLHGIPSASAVLSANRPQLSESAGGWVFPPSIPMPGAPMAPRGPMPTSMPPNMQIPPQVQAQRDADSARLRSAETSGGAGFVPTSAVVQGSTAGVVPVPGMTPKQRTQYDPERGVIVNLDTGVATPATAAGEPLGRKPEKPTAESLKQTTGVANLRTAISTYKDALQGFGALDILNPAARARIGTAYNNMLLQAKEAYNLGVLNGPDYMILQEVITNPTSMTGAITPKTALNDQLAQLDRIMSGVGETVQAVQADRGRGTYNAPKAPTVGAVVDGYRFKGGDPAKRESWVKQ
jgi:hypothetical protein